MPNLTKYEPGKKRDPAELAQVLRTVLQSRVELLKAAGREVLVLGDFVSSHPSVWSVCSQYGLTGDCSALSKNVPPTS